MARILVVDDHAPSRSLVSWCLQSCGHETVEAGDGVEALAVARADCPDLVISDALMPRMDGFSLCRAWMADSALAQVPFLFYSASYPSESDRQFGLSIGASGYLKKPMPIDELVAVVESALQEHAEKSSQPALNGKAFDQTHYALVTRKLEAKIAELNAMNAAYKTQRQEYERLFSANPQPMWIYDSQTLKFLAANDAAVALYGYTREEWLAMTIKDIRHPAECDCLDAALARERGKPFSDADVWTHIRKDGSSLQVEVSAHSIDFNGRPARVVMAMDVTERLLAQEREKAHLHRIEDAMRGTIKVVNRMVELRDPYTAGHERRTAVLCDAIGTELGMSSDQLDGLTMAALVHDIGKIAIPTDILTKPGKLSEIERLYIQQHAEAGYELLKGLSFPWPIAEIVWQHHERMDGSGYPRGLSGEDILLEARILAVADTLEAMASHRPYRPAFPMEQALSQIEKKSGVLYDTDIAAACLRLFRERGYVLPGD
ncbi:HD domain-containing phosphohydrolase [Thioalkalivibrio sp. XN279]|uniref:HD domain-containing phosphohydrolase n=1 Tax=Thioalkalivibrio sp. XN279 TaxID=2714953 RepID=UPI001409FCB1|nr:HD domain-containing phosphohydrolase [Thioalkalivibrio sp. XN279]NHA15599.1 response regulator [Thioalkalivibrio sp. XN279]